MARKTLLTEAEIRRFMKLAKMAPIGDNKLQEYGSYGESPMGARDPLEDEGGMPPEEGALDDDLPPLEDEEPLPAEGEEGEVNLTNDEAETLVAALPALEKIAAQVEPEEGMEDLEAEVDLESPVPEEGGGELPPPEGEEELALEEASPAAQPARSTDDVVNEVARRVAARLAKANEQQQMVDQLAERIMARLVK